MTHSTPGPDVAGLGDRGEPLRVDHHVVVGAHHPRALGDRERAVARPGRAGHGLLQVADADRGVGPLPVAHDGAGLAGARRVVDHHDVERPVAQRGERIQAPPQRLGPVLGRDLHREVRAVLGERVAPGESLEVRRVDLDVAQHLGQPLGHTGGAQPLRRHVDDTQGDRNAVRAHQYAGATTLRGRQPPQSRELHVVNLHRATGQRHHVDITRTESSPTENVPFVHGQGSHSDDGRSARWPILDVVVQPPSTARSRAHLTPFWRVWLWTR